MILVVEPVFPNAHHAATNGTLLKAIRVAAGGEDVAFAAHPAHRDAVFQILGETERQAYTHRDIEVLPAGGIRFRRFRSQANTLLDLTKRLSPRLVVCLGTQPETLFALRLLVLAHPSLPAIAVLHGNLDNAVGWRSRDPRRRWFDDRASIRAAATSRRIQFVVLDRTVREAVLAQGLLPRDRTHVWPLAIPDTEIWDQPHRPDPAKLRIAFLGSAKVAKGFGDFAAITRAIAARSDRYEFSLIGALQDDFPAEAIAHIERPAGFMDRAAYLGRLRGIDYACLPLRDDTYTLTVSGAILDAIAAQKPLIALPTPAIRALFQEGPAGFLCDDLESMAQAIGDIDRLADPVAYEQCRSTLRRVREGRRGTSLAEIVAPAIAK